jgi:hypothetical protein
MVAEVSNDIARSTSADDNPISAPLGRSSSRNVMRWRLYLSDFQGGGHV